MTVQRKTRHLSPRGKFPDLKRPSGRPLSYGGVPQYKAGYVDWEKEMGFGLLTIVESIVEWNENKITLDRLDRTIMKEYNAPSTDPYRGSMNSPPDGFIVAIGAARLVASTGKEYEYDEDSEDKYAEALYADNNYTAQLAALVGAGLLNPELYRKGYKPTRPNPRTTPNTPLLNASFLLLQAYRLTYAAWISGWTRFSAYAVQSDIIDEAYTAINSAARTSQGSFLLTDDHFTDAIIQYLTAVTKTPDVDHKVELYLAKAKEHLSEILGAGMESPFWSEDLWEEVSTSIQTE